MLVLVIALPLTTSAIFKAVFFIVGILLRIILGIGLPIIVGLRTFFGLGIRVICSGSGVNSFLGLGLREPIVSWGVLLYSAQNIHILSQIPWLLITALFVVIAVLAFNFLGDGLRDAADPFAK
ncbi:hypothetical protein LCGC14_2109490 [marine sediment metagenome]|uniref:ABC transmembrane type-1 domain-containing protein n=1 Tax=marine sediment metagenome TaxID=412755 RepID=A0A0F9E7H5_9ZZZZ